jgi:hypothetical protein
MRTNYGYDVVPKNNMDKIVEPYSGMKTVYGKQMISDASSMGYSKQRATLPIFYTNNELLLREPVI